MGLAVRGRRIGLAALVTAGLAACGSGSATVPSIAPGSTLEDSFQMLHSAGFRVAVRFAHGSTIYASSLRDPLVGSVSPRAGTDVGAGGVVTLVGVPGTPGPGSAPTRRYVVPDFAGKTAEAALTWANKASVPWAIPHLPELPPSRSPLLFSAYTIVTQSPAPRATIQQGQTLTLTVKPA